jgi:3-oxoacyl-[acyl-carrier-protein] synthase-3
MGTIIEASAYVTADGSRSPGAVELADAAARECLEGTGRSPDELQLLINAGVYLDRNISEPAIAALIQEDIGANPEIEPGTGQGTLSFDIRNGACGLLTGMYLLDELLVSGTAQLGMVVGGDADPGPGTSEGFDFPAAGGAVLLSSDDSRPGLTAFKLKTFPEFAEEFQSYIAWHETPGNRQGRNTLTVEIDDTYCLHAVDCADSTVRELSSENGLDFADVDILIATASTPDFAGDLARSLGIPAARVATPSDGLACAHTSALAIALESLELHASRTALLVSAGAGITAVAALYRA